MDTSVDLQPVFVNISRSLEFIQKQNAHLEERVMARLHNIETINAGVQFHLSTLHDAIKQNTQKILELKSFNNELQQQLEEMKKKNELLENKLKQFEIEKEKEIELIKDEYETQILKLEKLMTERYEQEAIIRDYTPEKSILTENVWDKFYKTESPTEKLLQSSVKELEDKLKQANLNAQDANTQKDIIWEKMEELKKNHKNEVNNLKKQLDDRKQKILKLEKELQVMKQLATPTLMTNDTISLIWTTGTLFHNFDGKKCETILAAQEFNEPKLYKWNIKILSLEEVENSWSLSIGISKVSEHFTPGRSCGGWGYISNGSKNHAWNHEIYQYGEKYGEGDVITCILKFQKKEEEEESKKLIGTLEFLKNGKSMGIAFNNVIGPVVAAVTSNTKCSISLF